MAPPKAPAKNILFTCRSANGTGDLLHLLKTVRHLLADKRIAALKDNIVILVFLENHYTKALGWENYDGMGAELDEYDHLKKAGIDGGYEYQRDRHNRLLAEFNDLAPHMHVLQFEAGFWARDFTENSPGETGGLRVKAETALRVLEYYLDKNKSLTQQLQNVHTCFEISIPVLLTKHSFSDVGNLMLGLMPALSDIHVVNEYGRQEDNLPPSLSRPSDKEHSEVSFPLTYNGRSITVTVAEFGPGGIGFKHEVAIPKAPISVETIQHLRAAKPRIEQALKNAGWQQDQLAETVPITVIDSLLKLYSNAMKADYQKLAVVVYANLINKDMLEKLSLLMTHTSSEIDWLVFYAGNTKGIADNLFAASSVTGINITGYNFDLICTTILPYVDIITARGDNSIDFALATAHRMTLSARKSDVIIDNVLPILRAKSDLDSELINFYELLLTLCTHRYDPVKKGSTKEFLELAKTEFERIDPTLIRENLSGLIAFFNQPQGPFWGHIAGHNAYEFFSAKVSQILHATQEQQATQQPSMPADLPEAASSAAASSAAASSAAASSAAASPAAASPAAASPAAASSAAATPAGTAASSGIFSSKRGRSTEQPSQEKLSQAEGDHTNKRPLKRQNTGLGSKNG